MRIHSGKIHVTWLPYCRPYVVGRVSMHMRVDLSDLLSNLTLFSRFLDTWGIAPVQMPRGYYDVPKAQDPNDLNCECDTVTYRCATFYNRPPQRGHLINLWTHLWDHIYPAFIWLALCARVV